MYDLENQLQCDALQPFSFMKEIDICRICNVKFNCE